GLVIAVLLLVFACSMARGAAWLDRCSDEEFRLLIWEAEPHRAGDALCAWIAQALIIWVWVDDRRVWLRMEGWILFPWTRRLERVCREHLAHPETRLFLDLKRVRWISPGGRRVLRELSGPRVEIQEWPSHLQPLGDLAPDEQTA
ncbi:MAG: hypothetical protein ACREJP_01225, partial [Candidatus Methylomirabilales bacterium]